MLKMKVAALGYADKGWPVFPCRTDKTPYTENGVLDATTNKKIIEKWWDKHPNANIGFHVGGAGMMALDLDPGHDWDEIEANIGQVPDTKLIQSTPRGGEHLFFAISQDDMIPQSASKIAPNVDVRSFHSYVLLAPSATADGSYTWEDEGKPAYRTEAMVEAASKRKEKSHDHDNWIIDADLPENIAKAIKYCKDKAQIAIEGRNGDHMAYATAAMMKSYGLSSATALEVIWDYWNPRCSPPWRPDEIDHLERKVINAYEYNISPPGNMTEAYKAARAGALFKPVQRDKDAPEWENAKLIHVIEHDDSLVAVAPNKRMIEQAEQDDSCTSKKPKRGRKRKGEKQIDLKTIRDAAYSIMRSYPGKEWNNTQLSEAIAAHENVSLSPSTIRRHYLGELYTDKEHPVSECRDIVKRVWRCLPGRKLYAA